MKGGTIITDSEKQLMSLINSSMVLTSTRNIDEVLQLLIEEVLSVFDWADASVLFLYDGKSNSLKVKSAVGFNLNYLKQIQLSPNEGMSGKTFSLKKPQLFTSKDDTNRGMGDITETNMELYRKALGENSMVPTSTICAPLIQREECIGVLTIDSFSQNVHFTDTNLLLLQTFANQAIIAIENATLISQSNRSHQIHQQLTQVYMTQRGLVQITKTLSKLIKKDIGIINEFYDVLSFTSKNISEIIDSTKIEFPSEAQTRFQREVQFQEEVYDMYCFPIKIENKAVGMLMVLVEKGDLLDSLDLFAIEHATTVFALELQSQTQFISSQFNEESLLINEILKGDALGENVLKKKGLHSKENSYFLFTIEIMHESDWKEQVHSIKSKFSRFLFHSLKTFPFKVLIYENSMRYSLFIISKEGTSESTQKISAWLNDFMKKTPIDALGGGGRLFADLKDLNLSLTDSYKVLDYLKQIDHKKRKVLSYSDLGIYRLFLNIPKEEMESYIVLHLSKLIQYDKKNQSDLVRTLECYMEAKYSVVKTSNKLFVHENTVKYRLKKINKVLGISNLEGEASLQIYMALKAYTYLRTVELSE